MAPRLLGVLLLLAACKGPGTMKVTCPEGYQACGTECFNLQNDARHCGACDHACASSEECTAGMCQPLCPSGMHACNGACVSDGSLMTCGKSCTPCPQVGSGTPICDGKTCSAICDVGRRFCGGVCALCPGGGVKCSGTTCVTSGCPAGQHLCNGECVDENGGSCTDACLSCPAPPANAFPVCLNGGCETLCRPGFRSCASGCCRADFMEAGGYHSCQLTPAGSITCWGKNHLDAGGGGALGDDSLTDRTQPVPVANLTSGVVAVQPGGFHTCAMDQFGAVTCWGVASGGRLGDGTTSDKLIPTPVMGLGPGIAAAISAGGSGGCALTRGGEVRCWGENVHGEVGDGTKAPRLAPTLVADLGTSALDVSFGGSHACALMRGGTVRCWGDNGDGQLGDGTQDERTRPVLVTGLFDVTRISAGEQHTCAIRAGGEVWCWGDNAGQQLGLPATDAFRPTPVKVSGLAGATEVTAGGAHSCALLGGGEVQCWGANESGQLGDGTLQGRPAPAPVMQLSGGTSVSAGHAHSCARTQSGTRCWGNNESGQLGDGTQMNRPIPVTPN